MRLVLVILLAIAMIITAPLTVGGEIMPCQWADLKVTPDSLNWTIDEGSIFTPPTQRLKVEKVGDGVLSANWVVSSSATWLTVTPTSGKGQQFLTVRVKPSGMAAGEYKAILMFRSAVEEITITPEDLPVTLNVVGTAPEPEPPEPTPPDPVPPEPEPDEPPTPEPDEPPAPPTPEPECWLSRFIKKIFLRR